MLNTIVRLSRVHPGFAADHVLTFRVALLGQRYATEAARVGFVSDVLEQFRAVPGVRAAAVSSVVPFGGLRNATVIEIEGRTEPQGSRSIIDQRYISSGYFQAMQIPLVSGRMLTDADDSRSERVTIINRTMARQYFPNENPVNRRVRKTAGFDSGPWFRIVGVVDDVRHIALSRDAVAEMYHPIAQTAMPSFTIVVRAAGDPASMMPTARATVRAADPNLPIYEIRTMEERIAATLSQTRATMLLLVVTAILAAALSGVAIYGSIWYSVVQRTPEIGIRVALGASRASVFRQVVSGAMLLAGIGALLGAAGAIAGGSLLRGFLFDTRTTDPMTYAVVVGGVLALATAASIVPAMRAMRVDPIIALRNSE
jgi:predicted permease